MKTTKFFARVSKSLCYPNEISELMFVKQMVEVQPEEC